MAVHQSSANQCTQQSSDQSSTEQSSQQSSVVPVEETVKETVEKVELVETVEETVEMETAGPAETVEKNGQGNGQTVVCHQQILRAIL